MRIRTFVTVVLLLLISVSYAQFYDDGKSHLEMIFSANGRKVKIATDFPLVAKASNGYTPTMTIESFNYPYNFKLIIDADAVSVTGDTYRGINVVVTPKTGRFSGTMMYYGSGVNNTMSFDPPSGWPAKIEIVKYEAPYIWFKFSCSNNYGTFEGFGERIKFVGN